MYGYGNSMFLATHGILARTASGGGIDPDAQAFITAASITNPTQQSAINTLVVDLKGYNIWSKMKALYPFCGGTAAQHSYNLRDTTQYYISWNGGWTHSSLGATPNGINAFANTFFNVNSYSNNNHIGYYIRTNIDEVKLDADVFVSSPGAAFGINSRASNVAYCGNHIAGTFINFPSTDSRGLWLNTRTTPTLQKVYKNGISQGSNTSSGTTAMNGNMYFGARNVIGTSATLFSSKQTAFASIGDGLTDTEAANFYTAVQAFQTTLGRSIGTQTVSDADAQAFVTNAGIVDQVEANAINNLVIGLKADSLWTKMKAIYPMVGGTAATHKWNLKDPRDLDAAFRLVFNGGWTHSSTGALPNGTNAYADTKLNTSTVLGANSAHLGYYSRTNSAVANELSMGNLEITTGGNGLNLVIRRTSDVASFRATDASTNGIVNTTVTDSRGLFVGAITSATSRKFYKNSSLLNTLATNYTWVRGNAEIFIGAACDTTTKAAFSYTNKETAFNCIGDGLTDAEVSNLYTAVQAFNTTLNRQV